ncbi:MAG: response regulator [Chloroflexota bacterium]|nr:MAG: response regulator [Chloroflexota bacterium]
MLEATTLGRATMTVGYKILIVDEEDNVRSTLEMIFQRNGYSVLVASNGLEARDLLKTHDCDLVLMDLKTPNGGLRLLREIRDQYTHLPVLILTGNSSIDIAAEAIRIGARDYLLKPVDPWGITSRVDQIRIDQQNSKRRREIMAELQKLLQELNHSMEGCL